MNIQNLSLKGMDKTILYQYPIDKTYSIHLKERKNGTKISILSDTMFKAMFYDENRIKYSCKFLSYFLNITYEQLLSTLKLSKNELDKGKEKSKGERSDYVARIGNSFANIEVNCNDSIQTMERNMDYAHHIYYIKIQVGSQYHYTQVIQFNLNNFSFKGNDKIFDSYYIQNEEGILLNDKLIFVQIYSQFEKEMVYYWYREFDRGRKVYLNTYRTKSRGL